MKRQPGRRHQVLEALRGSNEALTVTDLARRLKVHGNTIRFHLESLLADRLIEVVEEDPEDRPVGRPAVRYNAVARVAPSQMRHTETLVKLFLRDLTTDPDGLIRAEEIGESWGRSQAAQTQLHNTPNGTHHDVYALTTLLDDMGFESDEPEDAEIMVKTCPFLDKIEIDEIHAQEGNPDRPLPAVCAVHLGVMKGALTHWEADHDVADLEPFARVDRCRIQLARQKS